MVQTYVLDKVADSVNKIINSSKVTGKRIACIGTSLVQQQHTGSTSYVQTNQRGWLPWAIAYTKGNVSCPVWWDPTVLVGWEPSGTPGTTRYFQGLNFGVSGQFIQQIQDRIPYIIQNYIDQFDIIVVDAGTNDMAAQTKEYIQSKREAICQSFLDKGKIVILLPILNRAVSSWASGGPERKKCNWINKRSREYANRTQGVFLFDWNKYWVNFNNVDGEPFTTHTGDGIHFDVEGAERVGEGLAQFLSVILPPAPLASWSPDNTYDAAYNPKGSFLPIHPMLLGGTAGTNGTGSTGTVVTNGRVERSTGSVCTVANTVVARADGRGNDQVMTFTMSGTTDEVFYFRTATANTTPPEAGKFVQARCEVDTNASDMIYNIELVCEDQAGIGMRGDAMYPYTWSNKTVLSKWATKSRSILLETPPILLDAASTQVRWRVAITVRGGGSVAPIIKVGCVELCYVDDPRVPLPTIS